MLKRNDVDPCELNKIVISLSERKDHAVDECEARFYEVCLCSVRDTYLRVIGCDTCNSHKLRSDYCPDCGRYLLDD